MNSIFLKIYKDTFPEFTDSRKLLLLPFSGIDFLKRISQIRSFDSFIGRM
ncbi:hypothetical protein D932_00557 [Enterococcus casseliflavus 14-MB-W-14]|nr:hypothetical protein D932_00557 [Enterococcus casseliflavus 14-MB-W-14]